MNRAKSSHPEGQSAPIAVKVALIGVINKTFNRPLATVATKIWNSVRPGENGTRYRRGYYMNSLKVDPDKPCATIPNICPGGGGHMHWKERRTLTIEEAKRLSAFPDEFIMTGSFTEQWMRLGNSVPPLLARAIAVHIRKHILDGRGAP